MKRKAKLTLGTLMACLIVGNVGFAETVSNISITDGSSKTYSDNELIVDYTGRQAVKVSGTNSNLQIDSKEISISANPASVAASNGADAVIAQDGGKAVIGNSETNNVTISAINSHNLGYTAAITALRGNSSVVITSKNVMITADSTANGDVSGLWVQNNNDTAQPGDNTETSEIIINADNTVIDLSATKRDTLGIVNYSGGRVIINGNLEVLADDVINTRGNAVTKINTNGENSVVKLNGDINFNITNDGNSGLKANANVDIRLTNADSYLNGNIIKTYAGNSAESGLQNMTIEDMNLEISNGAQWNPTYVDEYTNTNSAQAMLAVNDLTSNNGIINLENMRDQELKVENISGGGLTVNVASSENKLSFTESNSLNSLTVAANQAYAEQLMQNDMGVSLQQLANQVVDSSSDNDKSAATNLYLAETAVTGVTTAEVDENGKVVLNTVNERVNISNDAISNMASIALMAWRAENNDMNKRLGELRDSKGEHGIWARMVRGEGTYKSIKNQYNTYQLGYDEKLSTNDKWTVGAAVSYTEGESGFNGGSGENKHTGFSVYGSYLNDDGSFVDLIAKYARLDHDFDVIGGAGSGDYETNGYSVSAEYGKRFKQDNGMWIEPQVELTYGKIGSANYKTDNGVSVRQDGMESIVGRVGFALGKDFDAGNAYVRASYLYDFDGETDISFTKGNVTRGFEQDLGGGWFEVGVGTNINLSDATHIYMDVEKTYGGDVATPWQWNVGVRYSF